MLQQPDIVLNPTVSRMLSENDLKEVISSLSSLSQEMLCAAKEGEWDRVVDLEHERASQLEILTATGQMQLMPPLVRQTITSVIALDKEVIMLATAQKDALLQEARSLGNSRKAVNAYLNHL